jgi:hypothetical protein
MEAFLVEMAAKYPVAMAIIVGIGIFRVVFKPIVSLARAIAQVTPGKGDDEFLDQVEASPLYKKVAWIVDYLSSIKLPGQK